VHLILLITGLWGKTTTHKQKHTHTHTQPDTQRQFDRHCGHMDIFMSIYTEKLNVINN